MAILLMLCLTASVLSVTAQAYNAGDTIEFGTYPQSKVTDVQHYIKYRFK
jgi:hypothetical protein